MKRTLRTVATLVILALAVAYILVKVDVRQSAEIVGDADPLWVVLSVLLILAGIFPMAWRWRLLLQARGIRESLLWLARAYFVGFAVGQVLPTSVGGDASRIFETARRHPGEASSIAGSVLVERAVGGVVTLVLAAVGFLLAIGRFPIGPYLWIELVCVFGAVILTVVFFSRRVRDRLVALVPLTRKLRVERFARAVYEGVHGYRNFPAVLAVVGATTVLVQVGGILSMYAASRAVGIDVSPLAYVVFGPLLFLVTLVPFTINGLGVREAFFVSFLGKLDVAPEAAFACGFLFFLTTVVLALPGLAILLWDGVRRDPAAGRPA